MALALSISLSFRYIDGGFLASTTLWPLLVGSTSSVSFNHSSKMHRYELEARNRQTDRQTDGRTDGRTSASLSALLPLWWRGIINAGL